jgi:hypothetical protein
MSKLPPRFTKTPPLGQGYDKTNTLEFFDGVLHQLYVGGHPGSGEVWVPVAGQLKEEAKPAEAKTPVPKSATPPLTPPSIPL